MTNKETEAPKGTSQPEGPYILKETDLLEIQPVIDVGQGIRGVTLHIKGMEAPVLLPIDFAQGMVLALNLALVEADVFSDLFIELIAIAATGTSREGQDDATYKAQVRDKAGRALVRFIQARDVSYSRRNNHGVTA